MTSIWSTLGIRPTNDRSEIRRAYSRKLKVTHPEDDPEGFQALRAAYDQALQQAAFAEHRAAQEAATGPIAEDDDEGDWTADVVTVPIFEPRPLHLADVGLIEPLPPGDIEAAPLDQSVERSSTPATPGAIIGAADEQAHRAAVERLQALLIDDASDEAAVLAAFETVVRSPAMDAIAVHSWTEAWLAWTIAENAPRGDVLVEPAIAHFGWREDHALGRAEVGDPVLARRRDLEFLKAVVRPGHPNRTAYLALAYKPTFWRIVNYRTAAGLPAEVERLLNVFRWERPGLLATLDDEAVAFWEDYLSKPQLGPPSMWMAILLPVLISPLGLAGYLAARNIQPTGRVILGGYVVALVGVIGLQIAWLYAIARPRARWRETAAYHAPFWLRAAWFPLTLATLLAAALTPPSVWATAAFAVIAAGAVLWAYFAADMDTSEGEGAHWALAPWVSLLTIAFFVVQPLLQPRVRLPWRMRALTAFGFLGIFWLVIYPDMDPAVWRQMSLPLVGACAAFAFGSETLAWRWRNGLNAMQRRAVLLAGGVLTAATPFLLWASAPGSAWVPIATVAVSALVIAHKIPAAEGSPQFLTLRDAMVRFGWIFWWPMADTVVEATRQGNARLLFGGVWLLAGVAVGLAGALREVRATA